MKRYSITVMLHVAGIALLAIGVYLLVIHRLWFCAATVGLLLLATAVHLYRMQMVQMRMMRRLAESLRHDDMMLSFRSPYHNRPMEEMADELSEAMKNFRTRVLERNEMEAWQKLIRVLTHEIMCRRSKGLLEFVENYRKLTRLPAPVRRPVSVRELLTDLCKLYPEPYIHIHVPAEDITLHIDRAQVEQVLINLIKNAREACARVKEPSIEIGTATALSWECLIYVRDNGEGILPDVQDKVFVPFFTTKPSGSGIGLSLCRQIMNRHGGNITLQSAVGQGSCFTLLF